MTNKSSESSGQRDAHDIGHAEDAHTPKPATTVGDSSNWSGGDGGKSTERTTGNISWGQSTEIEPEEQAAQVSGGGSEDEDFPFYPFPNLLIYLGFAGLFLYLAIGIIIEYVESQRNPPAIVEFLVDEAQLLPGFVLCNYDFSVPLSAYIFTSLLSEQLTGGAGNATYTYYGTDGSTSNFPVPYEKHLECPGLGTIDSCLVFDLPLDAFVETELCVERISLSIALELNTSAYSPLAIGMGTTGYLFDTEPYADIGGVPQELLCAEQVVASCAGTGANSDVGSISCDLPTQTEISAPAGSVTYLTLTRMETKNTKCNKYETTWSTSAQSAKLNPQSQFLSMLGMGSDPGEYAFLSLDVSSSTFRQISYRSISWKAMFGSIAGWFGALSDGWGIITLILMLQATYLRRKELSQAAINIAKNPVESVRCMAPAGTKVQK